MTKKLPRKLLWKQHLSFTRVSLSKIYLVKSELPRVVLITILVRPMPYDGHLTSSWYVNRSGINTESYKHGPKIKKNLKLIYFIGYKCMTN